MIDVESDLEGVQVYPVGGGGGASREKKGRVDACGYLLKRRAFIGGYARRYFVVTWPLLSYWISAEDHLSSDVDARGIFDLSNCQLERGNGAFDIVLHHRSEEDDR